jgi:DUF4097 and DUF4098 domain-containing protein YvlB
MQQLNKSKLMSKCLWLLAACALMFSACAIDGVVDYSGDATVVEEFSFEVAVRNQNRFRLEGVNGSIDIVGVPGASKVEIWGERRVKSESTEDARAYLKNLEVRVTDSDEEVFVKTIQPRETQGRNLEVVYHIRMPDDWEALVNNVNGNVLIDSLAGNVSVGLVNGNVQLQKISGTISVGLTNGNVVLAKIVGNTLIALVNGNIDAGLTLPQQGTCEMSAVNGTIDLQIPQNTSAQLLAEVVTGSISTTGLSIHDKITAPTSVRGRLAGGEGKIALKTVNGNIIVKGF